jgi:hypothetical protein
MPKPFHFSAVFYNSIVLAKEYISFTSFVSVNLIHQQTDVDKRLFMFAVETTRHEGIQVYKFSFKFGAEWGIINELGGFLGSNVAVQSWSLSFVCCFKPLYGNCCLASRNVPTDISAEIRSSPFAH